MYIVNFSQCLHMDRCKIDFNMKLNEQTKSIGSQAIIVNCLPSGHWTIKRNKWYLRGKLSNKHHTISRLVSSRTWTQSHLPKRYIYWNRVKWPKYIYRICDPMIYLFTCHFFFFLHVFKTLSWPLKYRIAEEFAILYDVIKAAGEQRH